MAKKAKINVRKHSTAELIMLVGIIAVLCLLIMFLKYPV
jgi:hypothetical protein